MKRLIFFICIGCFCGPALAGEDKIDGNDLKQILSPAESDHNKHQNDLNANEMHLLLDKRKEKNSKDVSGKGNGVKDIDASSKGSSGKGNEAKDASDKAKDVKEVDAGWPSNEGGTKASPKKEESSQPVQQKEAKVSKDDTDKDRPSKSTSSSKRRRIPPGWHLSAPEGSNQTVKVLSDDGDKESGPTIGIRRGTEIRAKLIRATTNVDPGMAEFETTADCFGDFADLPAGTKIFLAKQVANGSNRLYFSSSGKSNVIVPDGPEFAIDCSVTDTTVNRQLGLVGAITTDKKTIKRSLAAGAVSAGKSVIGSMGQGGGVAAEVIGSAADTALDEKQAETSASLGEPTFVIFVDPQDVYIRVEKSF